MSGYYDYEAGREIYVRGYGFYALIQAAMRKADSINQEILKAAFPEEWADLHARYNAPGGFLPGEEQS